jgi:hypothetical protein
MQWIDSGDLPEFGDFRHYSRGIYRYGDWGQRQLDGFCSGNAYGYGELGYSPYPINQIPF